MATKKIQILGSLVELDSTLTQENKAADAKATGDAIISVENSVQVLSDLVGETPVSEQIEAAISNSVSSSHDHNNLYYTEAEVDEKVEMLNSAISNRAESQHSHDDKYYTEVEIDSKMSTLNSAISDKASSSHTHDVATTSTAGFMSVNDKEKLDSIAAGANAYTLPSAGTSLGGVKSGGDVTISNGVITVNDDSHSHVIANIDGLQNTLDGKASTGHSHDDKYYTEAEVDEKIDEMSNAVADLSDTVSTNYDESIVDLSIDGTIITGVKGDGSKCVLETQDTTYSAGTGISLSGTTFSNSGVRSITTGFANGTLSVTTNGDPADIAVKGLGSAAYTEATAYDVAGTAQTKANEALGSAKTYTDTKVAELVNSAPETMNTFGKVADVIVAHQDFTTELNNTITSHVSDKSNPHNVTPSQIGAVRKAGDTMTGSLTATDLRVLAEHRYPSTSLKTTIDDRTISYGAAMAENTMYGQLVYAGADGHYEYYMFPDYTDGKTGNAWHNILTTKNPVSIAQGGTGLTKAGEVQSLFMNSFKVTRDDITIEETDVLSIPTGIYHHEGETSTANNYPIAATRAMIEVIGQQREGTAAADGYPNGYWAVRVTYPYSGEQYWNHRTWSTWTGWRKTSNDSLRLVPEQYWSDGKYGIDMVNSDIINANGIYFKDDCNSAGEGINFYRSDTTWDTLVASGGKLYFAPNHTTDTIGTRYEVYHSGGATIPITKGGTGATTASGACDSIGAVKKSGDTMTGKLRMIGGHVELVNSVWPTLGFASDATGEIVGTGSLYQAQSSRRIGFQQVAEGSAQSEDYLLPTPSQQEERKWYNILTSKNPVTIAQGGTGATTAEQARNNLGVAHYSQYSGKLLMGSGDASAWVTWNAPDGTVNQMDLTKTATLFSKPVNIASGGTGATTANGACANLGAVKKSGDTMTGQLSISHNNFHTLKLIASSSNTAKEASIGFFQDTTEAWTLGVATGSNGTSDFGLYDSGVGLALKVGRTANGHINLYRHLNSNTSGSFGNSLQVGTNTSRQVLLYSGDDHAKISNQDASWFEYNAMYMYDTHTYFKKPLQIIGGQFWENGDNGNKYGIDMQNSDIMNANGIYFQDDANAAGEGINFARGTNTWDTLLAFGGKLYFAPDRAKDSVGTRYEVYHSGGATIPVSKGGTGLSQLTAGEVVVGNGTSVPTSRKIVHNTAVGNLGWSNNNNALTTLSTIAYWDGAYSGNSSNLTKLGTVTQGTWHASTIGVTYGGTGVTTTAGLRNLVHNSYSDAGIANTVDVFTLAPGIYHCEDTTSTSCNYPIAESRATVEVFGQHRAGTAAGDGYANGYWTVRITYASGKQFTNHRYWSNWSGWKTTYNSSSVVYSSSQPTGAQGMIWLKPIS